MLVCDDISIEGSPLKSSEIISRLVIGDVVPLDTSCDKVNGDYVVCEKNQDADGWNVLLHGVNTKAVRCVHLHNVKPDSTQRFLAMPSMLSGAGMAMMQYEFIAMYNGVLDKMAE
jgi:hypothetical protein